MTPENLKRCVVTPRSTLREVIDCLNRNERGVTLVLDSQHRLLDIVTDGDIRRAVLARVSLDTPIEILKKRRAQSPYPKPITAPIGTPPAQLLKFMKENHVDQVPLINKRQQVVDLVTLRDLLPNQPLPIQAIVMTGGRGLRLRPLTEKIPKPMLPVGDKPLLERILEQLRNSGIHQINLSTHYKSDQIVSYFGDGRKWGVRINYLHEDQPLGTAGVLGKLQNSKEPLLIMNGDILTQTNFHAMLDFHLINVSNLTVAVRSCELRLPYGVIETNGENVQGISEKPILKYFINAGVYLMNPDLCQYIPKNRPFDMPDLIKRVVAEGHKVVSFPIHEYWMDIGQMEDYQLAQRSYQGSSAGQPQ